MGWRELFRTAGFWRAELRRAGIAESVPATLRPRRPSELRALVLLLEHLSPEQQAQLMSGACFDVVGCESGIIYRIRATGVLNVDALNRNGRVIRSYCFGPEGNLPMGDVLLAQKLSLETSEYAALKIANVRTFTGEAICARGRIFG